MDSFPYTIDNGHGEQLTFLGLEIRAGIEYLFVENSIEPNCGPPMHVHFLQDESITIVSGLAGAQVAGQESCLLHPGQSIQFARNIPHRFWNAGDSLLKCSGYISPANNVAYFLSKIYQSTAEGKGRPQLFDTAYLLHRYRNEFDMVGIPALVKKIIFPLARWLGKLRKKHLKFADAPRGLIG